MKKGGILNPALNRILAETGHTDMLGICDRGFPVPLEPERLDLALVDDMPRVTDVLRAIAGEFIIDRIIVAEEMLAASPERYRELVESYPDIQVTAVPHVQLKAMCKEARAVIRTGDTVPYANLLMISG